MPIRGAFTTDAGRRRKNNEDACGFFPELDFYVVADGMGGHAAGEVASALAVRAMRASLEVTRDPDLTPILDDRGQSSVGGRRLLIAVERANYELFARSQQDARVAGMGTTVAAILFDTRAPQVIVCHVGDSRVYRVRANRLEQLTEDHSLIQQLLRDGKATAEELKTLPQRHVLMKAVGVQPTVQPAVRIETPRPDDLFLLCSDGLHGTVEGAEIIGAVENAQGDLQQACDVLVDLANARGGPDNCTVMLVQYATP